MSCNDRLESPRLHLDEQCSLPIPNNGIDPLKVNAPETVGGPDPVNPYPFEYQAQEKLHSAMVGDGSGNGQCRGNGAPRSALPPRPQRGRRAATFSTAGWPSGKRFRAGDVLATRTHRINCTAAVLSSHTPPTLPVLPDGPTLGLGISSQLDLSSLKKLANIMVFQ
ncbi:hypothetical protein BHE74_00014608 [Ensete ventricosum]|nr:hypothetical protein BHE74_00014608 [Ensete ventricosum]